MVLPSLSMNKSEYIVPFYSIFDSSYSSVYWTKDAGARWLDFCTGELSSDVRATLGVIPLHRYADVAAHSSYNGLEPW